MAAKVVRERNAGNEEELIYMDRSDRCPTAEGRKAPQQRLPRPVLIACDVIAEAKAESGDPGR
ncbi:MAG: hypothetical protein ABIQ75_11240, partial [Flavobacteriales bacterium]